MIILGALGAQGPQGAPWGPKGPRGPPRGPVGPLGPPGPQVHCDGSAQKMNPPQKIALFEKIAPLGPPGPPLGPLGPLGAPWAPRGLGPQDKRCRGGPFSKQCERRYKIDTAIWTGLDQIP